MLELNKRLEAAKQLLGDLANDEALLGELLAAIAAKNIFAAGTIIAGHFSDLEKVVEDLKNLASPAPEPAPAPVAASPVGLALAVLLSCALLGGGCANPAVSAGVGAVGVVAPSTLQTVETDASLVIKGGEAIVAAVPIIGPDIKSLEQQGRNIIGAFIAPK
jgi:hypothetical protein